MKKVEPSVENLENPPKKLNNLTKRSKISNHSISNKVKVFSKLDPRTCKLSDLYPELKKITKKLATDQQIQRYCTMVFKNKKQRQASSAGAGLKMVRRSPGTNRGQSRQKYSTSGNHRVVAGAPNNRGGRVALAFFSNQQKLKMNKKQRKLVISTLIYRMLKHAELYMIEDLELTKTSEFINYLKKTEGTELNAYLNEPIVNKGKSKRVKTGPVILLSDKFQKFFLNFSKVLNLKTSPNFFGLYNGFRLRNKVIFEKELLYELIRKHL